MASTGEVWKRGHRPALDGVRGIAALMRRLFGIKSNDLPYPCDECGENVPPFQGVRFADLVWCGGSCADVGYERTLI